jgi:cysteine desulfurase
MSRREIYLDYAASCPVDPRVLSVMTECLERHHANPASMHAAGRRAHAVVEAARAAVAARVGADPTEIVFTSGATESNNLALKGVLRAADRPRAHLVTSRIEHRSVLDPARALAAEGATVTFVDCERDGTIDPERVAAELTPDTVLVSIQLVNNETGVVQDIPAIATRCREHGAWLHVDAAQAIGKLPVSMRALGADLGSLSAHKCGGPKGIGALFVAASVRLGAEQHGGEQERRLRAGTAPTHQIVGMGKAFELADPDLEAPRLARLRDRLWAALAGIEGVRQNGVPGRRAAHLLNVSFPGVEGESLRFALRDLAVSAGSACAAASPEASHVLMGMGLGEALAASSLRFSVGRFTTDEEIDLAAERVVTEVARLREFAPMAPDWCSA